MTCLKGGVAAAFLFVLFLPATVGAHPSLEKKLAALEKQVADLQKTVDANNLRFAESMAVVDSLRATMQSLQGQGEEHTHYIETGIKKVEDKIVEYENRVRQVETRVAQFAAQMDEVLKGAGGKPPKPPEAIQKYSQALMQFNHESYTEAIAAMRDFQKSFPRDHWNDNAQYWVGEGYFALGDYEKAILELQKGIDKYPKGERVPASLLAQGNAFIELGQAGDGKAFLKKLVASYPRSEEAARARRRLDLLARK